MEGAAVATRAMQAKEKQPIKPLIVPPVKAEEINCEELKKQQKSDESLSKLWKHAEEKRVFSGKEPAYLPVHGEERNPLPDLLSSPCRDDDGDSSDCCASNAAQTSDGTGT